VQQQKRRHSLPSRSSSLKVDPEVAHPRAYLPNSDNQVYLHVYDLGTSGEGQALNSVLKALGTGAFHCGVEVYGKEWSFRGRICGGTGVFSSRPRCCINHTYNETVHMGDTCLSPSEVSRLLGSLQREWAGQSYDTLRHNCCHFSDSFCRHLGVGSIPGWVTNLAQAGVYVVDAGHSINTHRKSFSDAIASTLTICDGQGTVVDFYEGGETSHRGSQPPARLRRNETW